MPQIPENLWPRAALALAGVAIGGVLIAAYHRGGWGDEYATVYFANPAIPFGTAWAEVWARETNPPYFYLLARLWQEVTGSTLFAHRLINLLPLAFLVAWFVRTALRSPAHRQFLACLAILAFSGDFFMGSFPEYRSYFWQYCVGLVFLGAASIAYLERSERPDLFQLVALPFLITLHQVTALYTGIMLVPLIVVDLRRRHYRRATSLAIVAFLALLALGLSSWMQLQDFQSVLNRVSWIAPHGPLTSLWLIVTSLPQALGGNWVVIVLGALIAFLPHYRPRGAAASLILLIAGAAAVATLVVLAIDQHSPFVIARYFTFLTVEVMICLSLAIAPLLAAQRWVAIMVFAAAVYPVIHGTSSMIRDRRSLGDARKIAEIVAQCPTTRIHSAASPGSAPRADEQFTSKGGAYDEINKIAIADVASAYHLTLLPLAPDQPNDCPVIYWTGALITEAALSRHPGDLAGAVNEAGGFGLDAVALSHARVIETYKNLGAILVVEPWAK